MHENRPLKTLIEDQQIISDSFFKVSSHQDLLKIKNPYWILECSFLKRGVEKRIEFKNKSWINLMNKIKQKVSYETRYIMTFLKNKKTSNEIYDDGWTTYYNGQDKYCTKVSYLVNNNNKK